MGKTGQVQGLPFESGLYGTARNAGGKGRGTGRFREAFMAALQPSAGMEDMFREASQAYQVPLDLLKAVAKAESDFNPGAVSSKGAMGVMQLMPGTARGLGVENPFDARSNILGGAKYLRQNLDRYGGRAELALAAYNAGSGNVEKYGGIPPFPETQDYVKKVFRYMGEEVAVPESWARAGQPWNLGAIPGIFSGIFHGAKKAMGKDEALYMVEMMKLRMQAALASHSTEEAGWGLEEGLGPGLGQIRGEA